jgi:hypothetical protein
MEVDDSMTHLIQRVDTSYTQFKITPHSTNLNSTTRKLQSSLYELLSHQHPKYPWHRSGVSGLFDKENWYVSLKEKPHFWWIIKLLALDDDVRQIEFRMAVPLDFKEAVKTKFHNHEQWKKATLTEDSDSFMFPREENTDLFQLKYARHDMFSLDYDYAQQNTPMRDILTVSKELNPGEEVNLFIRLEAIPRKRWKSLVDYAWEQWDKGSVPGRAGINPKATATEVANLGVRGAYEVQGVVVDILDGVRSAFFNDREKTKRGERPKFINAERQELLVNGDLSKRTKQKRNQPSFKVSIMYTVTSKDMVRRDMIARSVMGSYADLNGDNMLRMNRILAPKKTYELLKEWKISDNAPNIMSVDEVGKLIQLPTSDLQKEFKDALESNHRVETTVHEELMFVDGILSGTVTDRGVKQAIHIQTKNKDMTATARAIIGSPRMGKDQMAINLVVEAKLKHNRGAIVLDVINEQNGHRGMSDAIRDHLPASEVIDLNLLDTENPIYLGLESIVKLIPNPRIAADRVAEEMCAFLLQDGDEDKLQTADHLREASKLTNADILAIKHVFTSQEYRDKLVQERGHLFDTDIWDQYNEMSDGRQSAIYTPIMRRIGQIMNSEFLKPIFCQGPNPALDLFKLIDEGKVIIFRMKSGVMSQRVIEILCYWIVLVVFLIKLGQQGKSQSDGTYLVLNEPHQYLTDGLAHFIERIFAEGPKYRLTPLLIFHNFKQFKKFPGFVDIMKSSSLNWHIFRNTNEDVYKELFGYLSKTFDTPTQAFEATKRYQYIGVWLSSDGEYYDPFVADALPMVSDRYKTKDNSRLTLEHSKKYGRPIEEVLAGIKRRNRDAQRIKTEEKVSTAVKSSASKQKSSSTKRRY